MTFTVNIHGEVLVNAVLSFCACGLAWLSGGYYKTDKDDKRDALLLGVCAIALVLFAVFI